MDFAQPANGDDHSAAMFTELQYKILNRIAKREPAPLASVSDSHPISRLGILFGKDVFSQFQNKTVLDFGCGEGTDAIEIARMGAARVIGIDLRDSVLEIARRKATAAGVEGICRFSRTTDEPADIIISVDAFEHFGDPAVVLRLMKSVLKPGGKVMASFGPTWYHPLGGHLFSVFPWAHLVFSERALIKWRSQFKDDGATRFSEVAGGLNQMNISRFERLVEESPLRFSSLELVPIRALRQLHGRLSREFTTAVVRCELVERAAYK